MSKALVFDLYQQMNLQECSPEVLMVPDVCVTLQQTKEVHLNEGLNHQLVLSTSQTTVYLSDDFDQSFYWVFVSV